MSDLRTPVADLLVGPSSLLLTVTVGSRLVRLTDGPALDVKQRATGEPVLRFESGLTTVSDTSRVLGWFANDLSPRTVNVECVLDFDVAATFAAGHVPWEWSAEVSELYPNQVWEDRRVLVSGTVTEPLFGERGEAFAFAVTEDPGEDTSLLLTPTTRVSADTFPRDATTRGRAYTGANLECDANIEGASYPLIVGCPGSGIPLRSATYSTFIPAVPMLYVERTDSVLDIYDHVFLIAGHELDASTIQYFNLTDGFMGALPVDKGVDLLGQRVSSTTPGGSGSIPSEIGVELYAAFDPSNGGGLPNPFGTGPLRRADHVIRWGLSRSTVRADHSQIPRLGALKDYLIDGFANDPSLSNWGWLRSNVLPLLPASVVSGPGGVYVAVWDHNARADQAVAVLEEGRNAERLTPVAFTSSDDVVNKITISFAPNASNNNYALSRTITGALTPEEKASTTGTILPNYWCRRSQAVFGVRSKEITTSWVWDSATAELVLAWMARAYTFPRRQVAYWLPRELDYLRPGDVVLLVDKKLSMSKGQVAHVESIVPESGGIAVGLTWWEPLAYPAA